MNPSDARDLSIRLLEAAEVPAAFPIVHQLRSHLDLDEFSARVSRQGALGYRLVGAFRGGEMVGVMGMRKVETLARGAHLHVDDLVVDERERGTGAGGALLAFAEAHARREQLVAIFLDSRTEVISFYEKRGYAAHAALLMRKRL
jgi:GNAT superfamily N-acetyltransferase